MNKDRVLLILGLAAFVVMADNWVVAPILPSIAGDMGISVGSAALIITAYMLTFGLFQPVFGYLGDRYGRVRVISLAMVFFTIAAALCAIAAGLTDLAAFRALTGVFAGSVMPVSFALIGDIFPINERQAAIGTFLGIAFLGQGLSTVIGGSIAYFLSWRGVFAAYAILGLVPTVLLIFILKNAPAIQNNSSRFFKPLANLMQNAASRNIYIIVFFEGLLIMGTFSFLGGFIKNQYEFDSLLIGLIMSAFGVMAIIGGRFAGRVSARTGYKKTIMLGLAAALLANLACAFWGNMLPVLIAGIAMLGLGLMIAHSTILTMATEFAAQARGIATSMVAFCYMGGGGVGTAIGSQIVGTNNYTGLFYIYAIGLGLLTLAVFLIRMNHAGEVKEPETMAS